MKKTILLLLTLMVLSIMVLSMGAICYAEEETIVENDTTITQTEETSDSNANLWFNKIWDKCKQWVIAIGSGLSIAGVGTAVGYALVKTFTSRTANKIADGCNAQTIADKTSEKLFNKMSNVALDVNIKPLMEHQYREMSAQINVDVSRQNELIKQALSKGFDSLEKLGSYFDCSVAVSNEAKEAFHKTIEEARALLDEPKKEISAKVEITAEAPKETKKDVTENY